MTTITNVRRESLAGGRVKGAMVRAHLQFVRDRLGEAAMARMLAALPAPVAAEVQGVLTGTWCAFESLILLDRAIARVAGRDERELMHELGRYSAQINLSTVYRAFHRDDIHEFFRHSATLHRQFQDFGTCEYVHVGEGRGRISVLDAVCFSPTYCSSEAGYLEQVIETHGGRSASPPADPVARRQGDSGQPLKPRRSCAGSSADRPAVLKGRSCQFIDRTAPPAIAPCVARRDVREVRHAKTQSRDRLGSACAPLSAMHRRPASSGQRDPARDEHTCRAGADEAQGEGDVRRLSRRHRRTVAVAGRGCAPGQRSRSRAGGARPIPRAVESLGGMGSAA